MRNNSIYRISFYPPYMQQDWMQYVVITSRFQCTNHKDKIFFSLSKSFSFNWGDGTMQVRIQSPS